jgi:hypothetical protein
VLGVGTGNGTSGRFGRSGSGEVEPLPPARLPPDPDGPLTAPGSPAHASIGVGFSVQKIGSALKDR